MYLYKPFKLMLIGFISVPLFMYLTGVWLTWSIQPDGKEFGEYGIWRIVSYIGLLGGLFISRVIQWGKGE